MKYRSSVLVAVLLQYCFTSWAEVGAEPTRFVITPHLLAPKPISPRLYSNFIELGYGFQIEPMCAELLYNRSFERFTPYKPISFEWFDLWHDPTNPALGYRDDWSKEDWYHSGYEHNPWFAAPGEGGRLAINEDSTFLIPNTARAEVILQPQQGGAGHGQQSLRVTNREPQEWAGLAQEGKFLHAGESYRFRGKFRSLRGPSHAEVRLYKTGDWSTPVALQKLRGIAQGWRELTVEFKNVAHSGWTTFALWLPPDTELEVDDFSLLPTDNYFGWRRDILDPLRTIRPGILRAPGGCFASFYDWRDGVGPLSNRPPQPSYFWGGQNSNDVGVAELAMLAQAIGSELMWCVNVHHPRKPEYEWYFGKDGAPPGRHGYDFEEFRNIEAGAKEAAELVAYCNLKGEEHPLAKLRAEHGFSEPLNIKYWELDNEVHRWFEPEEYADAVVVYSRAMKAVDPTIKIGMVTYGERLDAEGKPRVTFHERVPQMLEIAGRDIDFLADRGPADKAYLDEMNGWISRYNSQHGTNIIYCETEKIFLDQAPNVENRIPPQHGYSKSFMFSKWYYALKVAMEYLAYQRAGGDVDFVVFNNLTNTHSQCVLETPKEGVYLSAAGMVMSQLAHSPASWPLQFDNYVAQAGDNFQVSAAWDKKQMKLVLNIVNRTADPREVEFDLAQLQRQFSLQTGTVLWATDPFTMNTWAKPDAIQRDIAPPINETVARSARFQVRPWSFTEVVLE